MKHIFREIGVCAIALTAAFGGAAAQDITAEEAQYQALYIYMTSGDWTASTEGACAGRVSPVRTYENYDRSRSYYLCYVYDGPGDMPTWEDLETLAEAGSHMPGGVYGFIIPASPAEMAYAVPAGRVLDPVALQPLADETVRRRFGGPPPVFVRPFIEYRDGVFTIYHEYVSASAAPVFIAEGVSFVPPPGMEYDGTEEKEPPAETMLKQRRGAVLGSIFKSDWLK